MRQQHQQLLVLRRDPEAGPAGMLLLTATTSQPWAEALHKSERLFGGCSFQRRA